MNENNDSTEDGKSGTDVECEKGKMKGDGKSLSVADLRNASYPVLFIAAIFVVNAMETGSYRTPWPVAIVVSLAGLGLYGYSFVKEKRDPDQS